MFRLGELGEFEDHPLGNDIHIRFFYPRRSITEVRLSWHYERCQWMCWLVSILRQSTIPRKRKSTYSSAMLALVGAEAFGGDGFNSVVKDMERESGDTNQKLSGQVFEVLNGRREFIMLKSGGLNVFLGNFNSDTGVRWIRADIW